MTKTSAVGPTFPLVSAIVVVSFCFATTAPASAGSPSETILRNQSRIVGDAIHRQVTRAFTARKRANIRAEPTTESQIIGQYSVGADVAVVEGPTDGWYQVTHEDTIGYVWAPLVAKR